MSGKVIFIDVDGTIIDVPRGLLTISAKTEYAIKELISNGNLVFIASGRPKCLIPDYLQKIKGLNFLTCNGALSFLHDGTIIGKHQFEDSLVKEINDYCLEKDCLYFDESSGLIFTSDKKDPLFKEFTEGWNVDPAVFEEGTKEDDTYMMMAAFRNKKSGDEFYAYFTDKVHAVPQYGFESCDINANGISKGTGVKDVLTYFNINVKDAYAFGDGLNDAEMLKAVGYGYRMANGNDRLKEVTELVAPDVIEDGFYRIMVKEKLIKPLTDK